MIIITAGITKKITRLLVLDKSTGPVGLGVPVGIWEYAIYGIKKNPKRKLFIIEYFIKLCILITS